MALHDRHDLRMPGLLGTGYLGRDQTLSQVILLTRRKEETKPQGLFDSNDRDPKPSSGSPVVKIVLAIIVALVVGGYFLLK